MIDRSLLWFPRREGINRFALGVGDHPLKSSLAYDLTYTPSHIIDGYKMFVKRSRVGWILQDC